ncbi:family 16 glycoside hydrolase [Cryphonectria parasitica EP155]|uniref:Crh-like protein n=1 Tax=Cryphonectria parasitica (strain ATCC 38755 / EP155) TaxID=660469 RepID=A0A9P4YEL7_CRYP1|nr:family 16 glycoside hydrolase [Cryphonectria parasitica EP155]KAF3771445.1 family 16 glycoside hydrolase [Cryphonectria parasitica EP155]
MRSVQSLALGLSLISTAAAQTSTSCNPTEKTCPSDAGLDQTSYTVDFTQGASSDWNMTYGTATYNSTDGAAFTITEEGDAPTMQSNFYIFFGEISVLMKTAPGTGIVSTAILESDDLDEVDWEFLGGEATNVQTNYFGKGNTTTYDREQDVTISDSQTEFHNYTLVWTEETLTWLVDGESVRTLAYADAVDGTNYPQTPMRVKLGIWAGGDPNNSEGTIEWAGGETDYTQGPFTAYVKSVSIVNYNPAESYTYGDLSGSYESIELSGANATGATVTTSSSNETTTAATNTTGTSSSTSSGAVFASGSASASNATASSSSSTSSSSSSSSSVVTGGASAWVVPNIAMLGAMSLVWMLI